MIPDARLSGRSSCQISTQHDSNTSSLRRLENGPAVQPDLIAEDRPRFPRTFTQTLLNLATERSHLG